MKLNCHCGTVEAEINATINELAKIVRCNCSICKRKNAFFLLHIEQLHLTIFANSLIVALISASTVPQ